MRRRSIRGGGVASEINPTALPSVFFSRPKKGHSAPGVMWACA